MIDALETYLHSVARTSDHHTAVVRAVESLASRPWEVVRVGGILARCRVEAAPRDLGLTRSLAVVAPDARRTVAVVDEGQPYPVPIYPDRRRRGVFDPPVELARRLVQSALSHVDGPVTTALDLACGTGAFLLAAVEAGVAEVYGTDLDPLALDVARVAVPSARLLREDPLKHGPPVDLVIGAPPFVAPDQIDARLRWELQRRYPWLGGRFDLVIPHAAAAVERTRPGGVTALVLPRPVLVKPYAARVRRRWVERHRICELVGPIQEANTDVEAMGLVLGVGQTGEGLPVFGLSPLELLRSRNVPLNPDLMPGDIDRVRSVRARSVPLGSIATVCSGLVVEGPGGGGQRRLVFDQPGEGRVPLADADQFFTGRREWLDYTKPQLLHKCLSPGVFEGEKIVVQRARGAGMIRSGLDTEGVYVDHTCTVVRSDELTPERILELVRSPLLDAITRVEHGDRFDLYPRDVSRFPVPRAWLDDASISLADAWGLAPEAVRRLEAIARSS